MKTSTHSFTNVKLLKGTMGPLQDFFKKLLTKDGHIWLSQFKKFLRKEPIWLDSLEPLQVKWKIWKQIKMNNMKNEEEYRKELKQKEIDSLSFGAIPSDFDEYPEESLFLTQITIGELGFREVGRNKLFDILPKIIEQTATIGKYEYQVCYCPIKAGVELRLQYLDQPINENITIITQNSITNHFDSEFFSLCLFSRGVYTDKNRKELVPKFSINGFGGWNNDTKLSASDTLLFCLKIKKKMFFYKIKAVQK